MTRALLVLACVLLVLLAVAGMWLGWRNRARRQAYLPALPAVPGELGTPKMSSTGLYVGTTFASSWQDRVVVDGLGVRAQGSATLYAGGLVIERDGAEPVFVPKDDLVDVRLAPGLAGKVMGDGGLLVARWRLGDTEVDTGFRADDKSSYPDWIRSLSAMSDGSRRSGTAAAPSLSNGNRHSTDGEA
jgi:hypothetical protein